MSNEPAPIVVLPAATATDLVHDLRNSLYALRLGLEALADARSDAARAKELLALLAAEERRAAAILDSFSLTLEAARK
jgi:hypothetical protein